MRGTLAIGLCVLAGCGGAADPPAFPPGATVVAAVGDSIIEGAPYAEPPWLPVAQEALGEGWAVRACGVSGQRTDEIAARLDECARGAAILVVQGGVNDIAQGRSTADAARDLRAMVRRAKALGLRVLLADVLPWNDGHPFADEPIADLNRRVRAIGRDEGVALLAFHATLEDPAQRGTIPRAWVNGDGDHPSEAGYERLGAVIAQGARRALPVPAGTTARR